MFKWNATTSECVQHEAYVIAVERCTTAGPFILQGSQGFHRRRKRPGRVVVVVDGWNDACYWPISLRPPHTDDANRTLPHHDLASATERTSL